MVFPHPQWNSVLCLCFRENWKIHTTSQNFTIWSTLDFIKIRILSQPSWMCKVRNFSFSMLTRISCEIRSSSLVSRLSSRCEQVCTILDSEVGSFFKFFISHNKIAIFTYFFSDFHTQSRTRLDFALATCSVDNQNHTINATAAFGSSLKLRNWFERVNVAISNLWNVPTQSSTIRNTVALRRVHLCIYKLRQHDVNFIMQSWNRTESQSFYFQVSRCVYFNLKCFW